MGKKKTLLIHFDLGDGTVEKVEHEDRGLEEFKKLLEGIKILLDLKKFEALKKLLEDLRAQEFDTRRQEIPPKDISTLSLNGLKKPPAMVISYHKNPDCFSFIVGGQYYEV